MDKKRMLNLQQNDTQKDQIILPLQFTQCSHCSVKETERTNKQYFVWFTSTLITHGTWILWFWFYYNQLKTTLTLKLLWPVYFCLKASAMITFWAASFIMWALPSFKHRHARRARVIFCVLKAPGGCSTRWTHKGNSFMCTGVPDSSQCHYKV